MADKKFWLYYNYAHVTSTFRVEEFGYQEAEPNYTLKETRENVVIQYILDGKCAVQIDGQESLTLHKGQAVVIRKNTAYQCVADENLPCTRFWLALDGENVEHALNRIKNQTAVISGVDVIEIEHVAKKLYKALRMGEDLAFLALSQACKALDCLAKSVARNGEIWRSRDVDRQRILQEIKRYMDSRLDGKITVQKIAHKFGYERSYLYRIFMEENGISPQKYILSKRMEKAKRLLSETDVSISLIASQVGYESYASFNKIFVKEIGVTPGEFRNKTK